MSKRHPSGFISAFYDPLKNPDAPTIGTATGGDASASVTFTAPANVGGSAISEYYAISDPSRITASAASSPINVTGLTNGTPYTFQVWALNTYGPSAFSASSNSATPSSPPNALFAGGGTNNVINSINISTIANAIDFGDLSVGRSSFAGCASTTRAVFGGGENGALLSVMDYVTVATAGNATNFGSLTVSRYGNAAVNNATRGVFAGGQAGGGRSVVIDYITIATTGSATNFGNLTLARMYAAGCCSPTRGVFGGGYDASGTRLNNIDYITTSSTGNATDFGDLTVVRLYPGAASSSTRGIWAGGNDASGSTNILDYVTIASTGNATDFGDLLWAYTAVGVSDSTRAVYCGGFSSYPMNYITIASGGNATFFGDLPVSREELASASAANGGTQ
jgi:hypothetical protein